MVLLDPIAVSRQTSRTPDFGRGILDGCRQILGPHLAGPRGCAGFDLFFVVLLARLRTIAYCEIAVEGVVFPAADYPVLHRFQLARSFFRWFCPNHYADVGDRRLDPALPTWPVC
jgi:hypothetical protein